MRTRLSTCLLAATVALSAGCGDELAPAWQIRAFRLFGARIANVTRAAAGDADVSEAAIGEQVRLSLSYVDPATTPRPLQVVWVFCSQLARGATSFGCDARSASVAMGAEVTYTVPDLPTSVDTLNRAQIQALVFACAGGTIGLDPTTMAPSCAGEGAESWTMIRSILVRRSEATPPNHNPRLTEAVLLRNKVEADAVTIDADAPVHVPRCASAPCPEHLIELRVVPGARETYESFDNQAMRVTVPERIQFGYFTDRGTIDNAFRVDSAERPNGPIRNTWTVPQTPGPVTFVFTTQDTRGGFDFTRRTIIVD